MSGTPTPSAAGSHGLSLSLLATLQLANSAFPAGLYAFSHGLETAIQEGFVRDAVDLERFVAGWLGWSIGPGDAVVVGAAVRTTQAGDLPTLLAIDAAGAATKLARESREASQKAGRRLMTTAVTLVAPTSAEPGEAPDAPTAQDTLRQFARSIARGATPGTYSAAFGAAAGALGVTPPEAILAELHGAATAMLGAALRLMRVDHQQTQGILRHLAPRLAAIAGEAAGADWRWLRPTAPFADVLQIRHEAAHVRLFMS